MIFLRFFLQADFICLLVICSLTLVRSMIIRSNRDGSHRPQAATETTHHHNTHHRRRFSEPVDSITLNPALNPAFVSPRVAFASHRPLIDPWQTADTESDADLYRQAVAAEERGRVREELQESGSVFLPERQRRSTNQPSATLVCPTRSHWVQRQTATNSWGQTVQVLQRIDVDGVMVDQFFYETKCESPSSACTGIDTNEYYSLCKTQHILAYAKVIHVDGVRGWQPVTIPSACNCALFRKVSESVAFLELLEQMSESR